MATSCAYLTDGYMQSIVSKKGQDDDDEEEKEVLDSTLNVVD